jgi:hypothetical protein
MLTQIEIREFMKNAFPGKNRSVAFSDEIRAPCQPCRRERVRAEKTGRGCRAHGRHRKRAVSASLPRVRKINFRGVQHKNALFINVEIEIRVTSKFSQSTN